MCPSARGPTIQGPPEPSQTNPNAAQPEPPAAIGASLLLPAGVNCAHCGYELQGLNRHSCCPECATPIEQSLRGDALIFADPQRLRRLRLGAECLAWGGFAWVFLAFLGWAIRAFLSMLIPSDPFFATALVLIVHVAVVSVLCFGVCIVTSEDETDPHTHHRRWLKPATRWIMLPGYVIQELSVLMFFASTGGGGIGGTIIMFTLTTSVFGWALMFKCVGNLYRRGRVRRLAQWADFVSVSLFLSFGLACFFWLIIGMLALVPPSAAMGLGVLLGLLPIGIAVLLVATLLAAFVVLVELGSWIQKARQRSEAIHNAAKNATSLF